MVAPHGLACQFAWAAARTKNTYLSSQFRRLAARRGKKRAIIAVAHTIFVIGYHLQKNQSNYEDLAETTSIASTPTVSSGTW
jgi:hypothetical protein